MFLLIVLAAVALAGIVSTVRALVIDGPQRVRTLDNLSR
jgi:hypothetical protein